MISGMTNKIASVSAIDTSRTSTDGESGKNEHSSCKETKRIEGGAAKKEPLYNRSRQREKLLCLQGIWAYNLTL